MSTFGCFASSTHLLCSSEVLQLRDKLNKLFTSAPQIFPSFPSVFWGMALPLPSFCLLNQFLLIDTRSFSEIWMRAFRLPVSQTGDTEMPSSWACYLPSQTMWVRMGSVEWRYACSVDLVGSAKLNRHHTNDALRHIIKHAPLARDLNVWVRMTMITGR